MKNTLIMIAALLISARALATTISGYAGVELSNVSAIIPISGTESGLISLKGFALVGMVTPAALTGTAITFESCASDGSACIPLKTSTSGTSLSYTVTTSSYYAIDPKDFEGVIYLKLKSGTTEGAARTLVLTLKGI